MYAIIHTTDLKLISWHMNSIVYKMLSLNKKNKYSSNHTLNEQELGDQMHDT